MKSCSPLLLLGALCALNSAPAAETPNPASLLQKFQEMDKNHDGKLERSEVPIPGLFERMDADHDGFVTLAEGADFFTKLLGLIAPATVPGAGPAAPPREAPKPLNGAESGIGRLISDVTLRDLEGTEHRLSQFHSSTVLVLASVSATCPVSKRYLPTLAAMAKEAAGKNVAFLLLTGDEPDAAFRATLKAAQLDGVTCLLDPQGTLRRELGSTSGTDAFVLDASRTLMYRGAVDDQYGLGYSRDSALHRYLADAIAATLAHQAPSVSATEAPGCALDLEPAAETAGVPTYYGEISRIVQAHCEECHRAGGVGPFALETYEQVTAKSGMIRKMVSRGLMPPWFAALPEEGQHSPWGNDRSLAERERAQLMAWLDAGKPAGNRDDAPVVRAYPAEWQIGTPDQIVQIPQPISVAATGTMPYQNIVVPTGLTEDHWVRGFEVLPTAREVVHHVLVFIEGPGEEGKGRALFRQDAGFLAAFVPGNSFTIYPDGFAKQLPAGSKLRFQIHYTPNGAATQDQVRVGLLYSAEPPEHVVHVAEIANPRLRIPPNDPNHEEHASLPVPMDVWLLGLFPHMHVRGKSFTYQAQLPDGTSKSLLQVPRYDFNWQLPYRYATPLFLPSGSRLDVTACYDNSADNPANPNPNATVRWGQQTTDEMMIGYVEYCSAASEHPRLTKAQ